MAIPASTRHSTHSEWRLSVAPMMSHTDRHCRYFHRQLTQRTRLYTEMLTTGAILHGARDALLGFHPGEQPLALQLGGSDPRAMAASTKIADRYGYAEYNINVGCPSNRVQNAAIGACLMAEPRRVAACVAAMRQTTDKPVTVKTRIGIDNQDDYGFLANFVETVAGAGCRVFMVHARKAWLSGLSPKENRAVPVLDYERVYRLKQDFPELTIVLNGGVETLDAAAAHLRQVDGVMIGRAAYKSPYMLAAADRDLFETERMAPSRHDVIQAMRPYLEHELAAGTPLKSMTRHLLGLYHAQPGGRRWRRILSEQAHQDDAGIDVIDQALQALPASDSFLSEVA